MSLDDRDYMRERHRRNADAAWRTGGARRFTPPREGASVLTIVAVWFLIAFALWKGYGWWQDKQDLQRAARHASVQVRAATPPTPMPAAAALQTVAPTPPLRHVNPATPPRDVREAPAPTTGGTIYLCKAYDGGMFWAQAHCNQHRAHIDRIASVPPGLPFDQQVQIAQAQRRAAQQLQTVVTAAAPTVDASAQRKAECDLLDERIRRLDARARQPLPAYEQDRIRAERKAARDRQFALRC